MDENILRNIAQQLRKPEGDNGKFIGQQMNVGNRWMNEQTIKYLDISSNDNILEIGMGNGAFVDSILMTNETVKYTGCDYSDIMVEEAAKLNNKYLENTHAKFYLATADKLPFETNVFDKVFAVNVFYFWENPSIELTEIKRILKPGGRLVISIRPKYTMLAIPYTQFGFNMYSREEFIKVFDANNFKIADVMELDEPDQEFEGQVIKLKTLIMVAQK